MADDFDSVLSGVKAEAEAKNATPGAPSEVSTSTAPAPTTTPPELQGVLDSVKNTAQSTAGGARTDADLDKEIDEHQKQQRDYQNYQESQKPSELSRASGLLPWNVFSNISHLQDPEAQAQLKDTAELIHNNAITRIASAFGHAGFEAAGTGATELLHPVSGGEYAAIDSMNKATVQQIGEGNALSNINMGLLNLVSALPSAVIGAVGQGGEETGSKALVGVPEALSDPNLIGGLPSMFHAGIPSEANIRDFVTKPPLPPEVTRAIDNGIIKPSDPAMKVEAAESTAAMAKLQRMEAQKGLVTTEVTPGLHDIVRQDNPELFSNYDRLVPQIEETRSRIHDPEIAGKEYDDKLADLKSRREENLRVPTNLEGEELDVAVQKSNARDAEIAAQIKELGSRNRYIDKNRQAAQDEFLQLDNQLRDITPQVNAAYEAARPKAKEAAFSVSAEAAPFTETNQNVATEADKSVEKAPSFDIAADIKKKLSSEGRTKEQAEAESKIIAARYETAAAKGWTPGSAEEVYKRHMAEIKATKGAKQKTDSVAMELAQGDKKIDPETQALLDKQAHDSLTEQLKEKGYTQDQIKDFIDRAKTGNLTRRESLLPNSITDLAKKLDQSNRGNILLASRNTGKSIIKLFKNNDASTLMHEMAHHWLDEMSTWEKAEDAPKDLKEHMQAVRDWLGKDTGEFSGFTKEQHEKWARGFERYLREGAAPNAKLANAFAHFKDWLSKIYKTADKLKVDISPAVRNVFDHMLAVNPERITVAAEHEPAKAIADIHEEDAKSTPPERADAVRDTIAKEVDTTAKIHDPEVADGIKNAEQTGSIPAETSGGTTNGATAGESAGEGSTAQESGQVASGGSGTGAEGVESRTEPTAERGSGANGEKPIRSKPVEKLFDKAGNIRLENLTNDEEARAALRAIAAKTPLLDHDVMGDQEIAELAKALGVKAKEINIEKLRQLAIEDNLPLAARVRAGREMMLEADKQVRELAGKVENGTSADLQAFTEAHNRFLMISETVSAITNQIGRALRAFQDISGEKGESANQLETLFQQEMSKSSYDMKDLAKLVATKTESQSVAKMIQASVKPGFWDHFAEYRRCSILSGFVTHALWLTGTGINLLYKPIVLDTLGGIHNEIGMALGREDTGSTITGGVEGLYRAITKALPSILSATGTAIRTGKTVLRPFEGELDTYLATGGIRKTFNINMDALRAATDSAFNASDYPELKALQDKITEAVKANDADKVAGLQLKLDAQSLAKKKEVAQKIAAQMQVRLKSWGELAGEIHDFGSSAMASALAVGKNIVKPGEFMKDKPAFEARRGEGVLPDFYVKGVPVAPIGTVMRGMSSRIYSSMHTFARETAANIETLQEARRMGVKEGLEGEDLTNRVNDLLSNPTKELMQEVNRIANKQTLMSNESQWAKAATRIRNAIDFHTNTKIGSVLMPVVGVPAEAVRQTVAESSPLGLLDRTERDALMGKMGATEQERAQVKMVAGTALIGLGIYLSQKGLSTPSPSVNYNQEQERRDAGQQSGSIRIGDMMVGLQHVPVTGTLITLGADLNHIMEVYKGADISDRLKPAVTSAVTNFLLHENALAEMADAIDAIRGKSDVSGYLKNQAVSTIVPAFIKQGNDLLDPNLRESKSFISSVLSRVPGESETLAPRINALTGEPLPREPLHMHTANPDPVAQQLMSVHMYPTNPHPDINGVELSSQQSAEYSSIKGHILHNGLQILMQGDEKQDFDQADVIGKRKMVQRIELHASQCAKSAMFNRYPELLKDANDKYEASCANETQ